jgi:DNA-binding transcriptional LysR family regulator
MVLDTLEAIIAMVHAGLGVSIVPMRLIEPPSSLPVRRVILPGPAVYRTLGLVKAKNHSKSALSSTLLEALQKLADQAGPVVPLAPVAPKGTRHKKVLII